MLLYHEPNKEDSKLSRIYFENLFLTYSMVFEIKQVTHANVWGTAAALFLQDKNHRIHADNMEGKEEKKEKIFWKSGREFGS